MDWKEVIQSVESSRKLLEALWNLDGEAVAKGIDQAHREISVLQYNDENSLSCTINLAFYFARGTIQLSGNCQPEKALQISALSQESYTLTNRQQSLN